MAEVWNGPIAIIGTGQLGSSLVEGLLWAGLDPAGIRVATRDPGHSAALAAQHGVQAATAVDSVQDAALVVVAVRPAQVTGVLDEIAAHLRSGAALVSLAGNPDHATLAAHLPAGTAVVRAMPNPAMAVGAGLTGICPAPDCPPEVADRVRALFSRVGRVTDVTEDRIGTIGSLAGHGQAVTYYVADAMVAWGVMQGFSRAESREVVAGALAGAAAMLTAGDAFPAELQHRLCTPGGTTIRSMAELDDRGVRGSVIACMDGGSFAAKS